MQRAYKGRPARQPVRKRSLPMGTLGLRGKDLARMGVKHGDMPARRRKHPPLPLWDLGRVPDQDSECHALLAGITELN
jgi:hypothetical protein